MGELKELGKGGGNELDIDLVDRSHIPPSPGNSGCVAPSSNVPSDDIDLICRIREVAKRGGEESPSLDPDPPVKVMEWNAGHVTMTADCSLAETFFNAHTESQISFTQASRLTQLELCIHEFVCPYYLVTGVTVLYLIVHCIVPHISSYPEKRSLLNDKYCSRRMCDSLVMSSALKRNGSPSKYSRSGTTLCASEIRFDVLNDQHHGNSSIEVSNASEETGRSVPSVQRNNAAPFRFQLEQDVQQLENQLLEEVELRAFLENVIERNAIKLSGPAHLPHHFAVSVLMGYDAGTI
ncbi:DUF547 domain-containing protein/Lzipper-MIP1 domain-containing protein [Senna tora]|uniref:DUF547 domain-containing protein/Lzipper-MIP1 domain-containing protein n=1 Tax=Senna tora TaxID=362788 RepID=A0A834XDP2_9FABA|nr:DUF547 domain-containing protein/Lzipper-MIP1 domain-containing protein [Senna tora]